jgi:hypothetical protein
MRRTCAHLRGHPQSGSGLGGTQVSFLTVMVEDAEDLDGTVMGAEGVRGHGREFPA